MTRNAELELLERCAAAMESGQLDPGDENALRQWWRPQRERADALVRTFAAQPVERWTDLILSHRSHGHRWYDVLAKDASLDAFATFMLENRGFPAFLPMVARAMPAQLCDQARAALQRNIDDEQLPVPHADLMRRLMGALKSRAGELHFSEHASRIDRTLAFHYGYHLDVWSMIGSLYVTEVMALHRLQAMKQGLTRLGLTRNELEFVHVHLECDEEHGREWSEDVIMPTLRLKPDLLEPIAAGIAVSMDTSALYLDHLVQRQVGLGTVGMDRQDDLAEVG